MDLRTPFIRIKKDTAEPVRYGDTELVQRSRGLVLALPGRRAMFASGRAAGVEVRRGGDSHYLPVRDLTRRNITVILAAGAAAAALYAAGRRAGRRAGKRT